MSEEMPRKEEEEGGAGWIMTFADLMSLLMCFFVLLLSFAELDLMKFKAIAGSMKLAFGVQREVRAIEVPKGTSLIAQEFSAGKPEPTLINEVRQQTSDEDKQSLEFTDALVDDPDGSSPEESDGGSSDAEDQVRLEAERLVASLREEVDQGMIQIETEGVSIIIRIREKGSFPSGQAHFDPEFESVIDKLRESLTEIAGTIVVAGHTDDIPIRTRRYRSNWDLSSARAVTVVHSLLDDDGIDPERFVVEGHGDAHPLAPNDSPENRALNRRVEIIIRQDPDAPKSPDEAVAALDPVYLPDPRESSVGEADVGNQATGGDALPDWIPRPPSLAEPLAPDPATDSLPAFDAAAALLAPPADPAPGDGVPQAAPLSPGAPKDMPVDDTPRADAAAMLLESSATQPPARPPSRLERISGGMR